MSFTIDNRSTYEEVCNNPHRFDSRYVEFAEKELARYKQFPPGPDNPHNRLIAHKVEVYEVKNPEWQKKGENNLVAVGELEKLLGPIDFGQLLSSEDEIFSEKVVKENAKRRLPNGNFIRRTIFKKVPSEEFRLEEARKYFEIDFNEDYARSYEFNIDKKTISQSRPLEFHIISYFSIDGHTLEKEKRIARMLFPIKKTYVASSAPFAKAPIKHRPPIIKFYKK